MNIPASTYRIQFHKDFNFNDFEKIIPYLIDLGVDTIYASPIFEAMPGSTHGYDVVNPWRINPEIGTEEQLIRISQNLKSVGIKWLQDIVPNHMAFHESNALLMDVLKNGEQSEFATFFDIDFTQGDNRLMVPFLGDDLEKEIENRAIRLKVIEDEFFINAGGQNWPVNSATAKTLKNGDLKAINQTPELLLEIVNKQHYRLCNWKETNVRINYRRFFTVNSLICLNIQHEDVFSKYHKYIFELLDKGIFHGLRIDHVDGLYDPKEYLTRLRKAVGDAIYIVVEKILEAGERMPSDWHINGNTGYDFLALANNLFTNKEAEKPFSKLYHSITEKKQNPDAMAHTKKAAILNEHMQGELDNLYRLFLNLKLAKDIKISEDELKSALSALLINMPVYRYYEYEFPLEGSSIDNLKALILPIINKKDSSIAGKLLYEIFVEYPLKEPADYNKRLKKFFQRAMQFTGPLMAKGIEDTLMFTYNRFLGHAEVGDAVQAFGLSTSEFHEEMLYRQSNWAGSMNGSSTHDTKKGEDVRARLNVLTDIPEAWSDFVNGLQPAIESIQKDSKSNIELHKNDIYMLLQTIIGALPFLGENDDDITARLEQFIQKALREAKKRSDWAEPDESYENALKDFAHKLIDNKYPAKKQIDEFLKSISDFAIANSLSQVILKFTCPGVPDLYQGTELWDLSLVDPDNRRPVDYNLRSNHLEDVKSNAAPAHLWELRNSGRIKLWLTQALLKLRKSAQTLFDSGNYIPLTAEGKYAKHILAFARAKGENWVVTVVPLGLAKIAGEQQSMIKNIDWGNTRICLPPDAPLTWKDLLRHMDVVNKGIALSRLFSDLPFAVIELTPMKNKRSAGILMHISALPSDYGIGDIGQNAKKFVDFLSLSKQTFWQILPINPTKAENGHSPYSSNSAMAGNLLLISPDALYADALLTEKELADSKLKSTSKIDFKTTESTKTNLLKQAYLTFKKNSNESLEKAFSTFCIAESSWLDNFAIYTALKQHLKNLEWYAWPDEYKFRNTESLVNFEDKHRAEVEQIKWQQFIFFRQWHQLRDYANKRNVKIIGDLPFYLDYDSVEVWSSPQNFLLDEDLNKTQVAGVPPDYFNETGQLWGMPVFNWKNMKADNYNWWLTRLQKNMELFDLLRLDHFRAFSSYWEVPAADENAINGRWKDGPDAGFFNMLLEKMGELPFIAEDLGETSPAVEALIRDFKLPNMKVLQFAFGEDLAESLHAPHNFDSVDCVVYSGTHDNNTVKGWFNQEADKQTRKRLADYSGIKTTEANVNKTIIRLCHASVARLAILPIQDVLGLDESARMNIPGKSKDNWLFRLDAGALSNEIINYLRNETERFGRC
ncbi:MAG: malto-oligosyltrehalose synthase [Sphingobacteriales bacterium]|nr:MAG: malto-oligosyltrehalose synthase [Sphingobacteriales bacterium]